MPDKKDTVWDRMSRTSRSRLISAMWLVIWFSLLSGLYDRALYQYTLYLQCAHTVIVLAMCGFRPAAFAAQVRIGFALAVAIGLYVPYMLWFLWAGTAGLTANLFLGYCPLSRILHIFPWNRDESLSLNYLKRVFFTPPVRGRFRPPPRSAPASEPTATA